PRVQILNDCQVQPAFVGWDVRDVGRPRLIFRGRDKLSIHDVLGHRMWVIGIGRQHPKLLLCRGLARLTSHPSAS
ncbi:MAG: hypothetical protein JWP89_1332, partial [Schlesneria sp.]|nr:hypothetical protein [Schlesneria sp.]